MNSNSRTGRSIGLFGATGVGVGAIVGGGILALAGVAFATTGPSAVVAFTLNGLIAVLTALSFAEMSSAFPESGGTYLFAKKVLTVEAAFAVGWVVWFASIVAAVLYAMGFGFFAATLVQQVWQALATPYPAWLSGRLIVTFLAIAATLFYTVSLMRQSAGGGQWANIGKVAVFAVLIAGGLWALAGRPIATVRADLSPFFTGGMLGLVQAMGFTFIALQGFDLIAAVAGEIREPARNIPRAMMYSLAIALAIYLPLLLIVTTAGMPPGQSIAAASKQNPETIVAIAAQNYLGPFGYWLVMVAAVLSMLSALQANLFAASRVALAMARDRTLPHLLSEIHPQRGTPIPSVLITAAIVTVILVVVPNVAAAGAASSLIFLITFTLAHAISILARQRSRGRKSSFRTPLFPLIPSVGGVACLALAVFQGIAVPSAGLIASVWLGLGGVLFLLLFARRARVVDASTEALDPEVIRLRGRSPLVLVPIANPANAEAMVAVANALAPPEVGRVLLLSVVVAPEKWQPGQQPKPLADAQAVLSQALAASVESGLFPEALTTVAPQAWQEIRRVARIHRCESLLIGLSDLTEDVAGMPMNELMGTVTSDVVVLRARQGWQLSDVRRVLVPIGGKGDHDMLRARLLGSLFRTGQRQVTYLRVVPEGWPKKELARAQRDLNLIARDEAPGRSEAKLVQSNSAAQTVVEHAADSDLVILGLQRISRYQKVFGNFTLEIARQSSCPIIMISRRG